MENILFCTGHHPKELNIVSAHNCWLLTAEDKVYLDLESGIWSLSLGHRNERVNQVIKDQVDKIMHSGFCYYNQILTEAATNILSVTDQPNGKCLFLCSGSEAVEVSIKMAKALIGDKKILTIKNSYHSAFGCSSNQQSGEWIIFDDTISDVDKLPFSEIGCFVFEPGSASGSVHFPSYSFIDQIITRIRDNSGIIIVNEVTTGIGRTGKWFGYNHYNIKPDIIAIGKGLGNGYPVSCISISEPIAEILNKTNFKHSQSHQNDPLGAVVANEVINIIKNEKLIEQARSKGNYFFLALLSLKKKYSIIKEIRGRGLMIAIEFIENNHFSFAEQITAELFEKGIIVTKRPSAEIIRIDPSLLIESEYIKYFLIVLESVLSEISKRNQMMS